MNSVTSADDCRVLAARRIASTRLTGTSSMASPDCWCDGGKLGALILGDEFLESDFSEQLLDTIELVTNLVLSTAAILIPSGDVETIGSAGAEEEKRSSS